MNKIVWIYFSEPETLWYPLNNSKFFESYSEIIEALEKKWLKTVIVRNNSYIWDWFFSHYFIWNGKTYEKINKKIKLDLLWNRDSENLIPKIDDLEVINNFEFDEICRDKFMTYELFKEFSADTFLLNSYDDLLENIDNIKSEKVVLKPRFWERCEWIYIIKKEEIKKELYENWTNILLQEFLDSSNWIDWMVEWLHEINIYVINWEFAWARLKKAENWNLICNISWENNSLVRWLKKQDIPKELLDEIKKIDKKLEKFPFHLYRADFVYTNKLEYKIIELNSRPWVMNKNTEWQDYYWDFNWKIVDTIANYLNK